MISAVDTNVLLDILIPNAGRIHIISDFIIGGHAKKCADQLVTRDRGFYRVYFKDLKIVDPTE